MCDFGDIGRRPHYGFHPGLFAACAHGDIGTGRGEGGLFERKPFDEFVSARFIDALDDAGSIVLHEKGDAALGLDAQGSAPIVPSTREFGGKRISCMFLADHLAPMQQELLLGEASASEGFARDDRQKRADVLGESVSPLGILHGREYSIGLWVFRSHRICR